LPFLKLNAIFGPMTKFPIFALIFAFCFALSAVAARTEVSETGSTEGEKEARKFFRKSAPERSVSSLSGGDHYLALHLGAYLGGDSYQWGDRPHVANPGRLMAGMTYRIGQLSELADWALRVDFIGYELPDGRTTQVGIIPMILFPEAGSQFPLYFGIGAGPGIFFQQLNTESFLALDYQIVGGARLFNLVGSAGFFIEAGIKNHLFLLSDGQLNGTFLTVGTVFVF
jgi:hypothetical protein